MQIENPAAAKINECHAEFVSLGKRNSDNIVAQINKAREIGVYLQSEKERVKRGEWLLLFSSVNGKVVIDYQFHFSYETAKNYLKVASALPEPITSLPEGVRVLTDIFRMPDALPAPERDGEPSHSPSFFGRAVKHFNGFMSTVSKWRESEPVENWSEEQKSEMRSVLQPAVDLYKSAGGNIGSEAKA